MTTLDISRNDSIMDMLAKREAGKPQMAHLVKTIQDTYKQMEVVADQYDLQFGLVYPEDAPYSEGFNAWYTGKNLDSEKIDFLFDSDDHDVESGSAGEWESSGY